MHPETVLERLALLTRQVPIPVVHALGGPLLARVVMVATGLGIFERVQGSERTAGEVAEACGTHPYATGKLLDALVSAGYLARRGPAYRLTWLSRKWLLKNSPTSLHDLLLYEQVEWDWLTRLEAFIQTGQSLDVHTTMARPEWERYQRAMRAIAGLGATELARRVSLPTRARAMLDIGGSHGCSRGKAWASASCTGSATPGSRNWDRRATTWCSWRSSSTTLTTGRIRHSCAASRERSAPAAPWSSWRLSVTQTVPTAGSSPGCLICTSHSPATRERRRPTSWQAGSVTPAWSRSGPSTCGDCQGLLPTWRESRSPTSRPLP